jgi:hypothetical protein
MKQRATLLLQEIQRDPVAIKQEILDYNRSLSDADVNSLFGSLITHLETCGTIAAGTDIGDLVAEIAARPIHQTSSSARPRSTVDPKNAGRVATDSVEWIEVVTIFKRWKEREPTPDRWNVRLVDAFLEYATSPAPERPRDEYDNRRNAWRERVGHELRLHYREHLQDLFEQEFGNTSTDRLTETNSRSDELDQKFKNRIMLALKLIRRKLCTLYPRNQVATQLLKLARARNEKIGEDLCGKLEQQ